MIRETGVITRIFVSKGYAFLRGNDGYTRFFNAVDLKAIADWDRLREGMSLSFTPFGTLDESQGAKHNGLSAEDVVIKND